MLNSMNMYYFSAQLHTNLIYLIHFFKKSMCICVVVHKVSTEYYMFLLTIGSHIIHVLHTEIKLSV